MTKQYIADSAYAEYNGFELILTTEKGLPDDPSNIIYLEPTTWNLLLEYVERLKAGRP